MSDSLKHLHKRKYRRIDAVSDGCAVYEFRKNIFVIEAVFKDDGTIGIDTVLLRLMESLDDSDLKLQNK